MKKIFLTLAVVTMLLVPTAVAQAATTQDVTVTATPIYVSISNTPGSEGLGTISANSTTWAYAAIPADPLADPTATFTVTNDGSVNADIGIKATDFTGGVGWTLASSVGENIVVMKAGFEGETHAQMQVVTTSNAAFITGLAPGTLDWEFSLDTGLFTDGVAKESTITLTATAS